MISALLKRLLHPAAPPVLSKKERWHAAAVEARSFAALLLLMFVGIKFVLFFTESAIELKWWEWLPIWPAMTYQHLLTVLFFFGVYSGLLYLGSLDRRLGVLMIVLVCGIQFVFPFLHISSLRVEQIVGSYTTFEMTQADSEGTVFLEELFEKGNLPFTIPGLILSVAAVAIPLVFRRRAARLLSFLTPKRAAIALGIWLLLGMVGARVISSFIGVAADDPVIFFYADMAEKKLGLFEEPVEEVSGYPTKPIYGDDKVVETRKLFENLDKWRAGNRNVVLIVLESMPSRQSSFMGTVKVKGEKRDTNPTLRKMRKHMLRWRNHYTVHPASMNSLFSINCSMYPYPAGNNITATNPRIPCHSMSEVLAEKGYVSALFHSGRFSFWNKTKFFKNRGFSKMYDAKNMPGVKSAQKFKWGIDELHTANRVVDFIRENRKKPFFVEYITVFPHSPYDYKPGPWAIFDPKRPIDRYHNCLRYTDTAVKRVMDGVKRLGLEDDTLFIFVSDHGEAFYEHRGNRVHSIYVYEENVHTAFGMYNPVLFPKGRGTSRVTSHVDILPTVADLLDIPRREPWQGFSLLKDMPSPLVYFVANWGSKFGGVRDGRYKAIWDKDKNKMQLFDLKRDGKERKDLADEFPERLEPYRSAIIEWWMYQVKLIPSFGK